ncbi:unnamed protein product, partial [Heterosigma akashiwo]
RVQTAIDEAGKDAYGIIAVDVWFFSEKDSVLRHFGPNGVNWISPIFRWQLEEDGSLKEALDQLVDEPADQEISGVGLAGNFWRGGNMPLTSWRDLQEFIDDPDQMPCSRLVRLGKLFGKCAGVGFNIGRGKCKGVVLYYARKNADESMLSSEANASFLNLAAYHVGAAAAMTQARAKLASTRKEMVIKTWKRVHLKFHTVHVFEHLKDEEKESLARCRSAKPALPSSSFSALMRSVSQNVSTEIHQWTSYLHSKLKSVKRKSTKTPLKPPPAPPLNTTLWTWLGSFTTFMVLFSFDLLVKSMTNERFGVILGPFGALLTLQFALTAAPASQPRNSFFGIIISLIIALVTKLLIFQVVGGPQWFAAALGTSLAIGGMSKAGVVHPPAGACAMVFALSSRDFASDCIHVGLFLCADLIAVAMAVLMNNLSDSRQYPVYWALTDFIKRR